MSLPFLTPDWPAPPSVRALATTRAGGVSTGPYGSLNLGDHVGDEPAAVTANRLLLRPRFPAEPLWLQQVHGTRVVEPDSPEPEPPEADAAVARRPGQVCVVLTADCLPVLFCDVAGRVVAAAHAGWRGLLKGLLERTVEAMAVPPREVLAWLGPAIGPAAFEVGGEVRDAFIAEDPGAVTAFHAALAPGKWLADLPTLARQRLAWVGVDKIHGGDQCTYRHPERFFSYRRDGVTGRQGSFIWLADSAASRY